MELEPVTKAGVNAKFLCALSATEPIHAGSVELIPASVSIKNVYYIMQKAGNH